MTVEGSDLAGADLPRPPAAFLFPSMLHLQANATSYAGSEALPRAGVAMRSTAADTSQVEDGWVVRRARTEHRGAAPPPPTSTGGLQSPQSATRTRHALEKVAVSAARSYGFLSVKIRTGTSYAYMYMCM